MNKEQIFQLKLMALNAVAHVPGDLLENAEQVYQWLTKEQQEQKAKQVAPNQ